MKKDYAIELSPYAKIFFYEWKLNPNSNSYNEVIDQILYGTLDIPRLALTLRRYVAEHIVLNSCIREFDSEPYWIPSNAATELQYPKETDLLTLVKQGFNLHHDPLCRFMLVRLDNNVHRFVAVFHHLVADGMSINDGIITTISNYYNYADYIAKYSIVEQAKLLTDLTCNLNNDLINSHEQRRFWQEKINDIEAVDLNFLQSHHTTNNVNDMIEFSCDQNQHKIYKISGYAITPYVYGLCVFAILLHRYTGQKEFAITYPVSIKEGADFVYGAQLNTCLVAYNFENIVTVADLIAQTLKFFQSLRTSEIHYDRYPITNIATNHKHLLNAWFVQTNLKKNAKFTFDGITKVEVSAVLQLHIDLITKNTLVFEQEEIDNKLVFKVKYDCDLFDRSLLNNFVSSYQKLYAEILADPSGAKSIFSYRLLTNEQYRKIVYDFNATNEDCPRDKTIHQLFEEQTLKTPNNTAVIYEDTSLTYQELNNKANKLANYLLQTYTIKPDDIIALCLNRNEYMLIAILGVLKAGVAYVPINSNYPNNRIEYILSDTKTKVVLTNSEHIKKIKQFVVQAAEKKKVGILAIDSNEAQLNLSNQKNTNPITTTINTNLAYVIYTSGTTGNPKGVLIEHRSVVNYSSYLINNNKLDSKSIGSQYSDFGFDAFVCESYPILLSGGIVCVVPEQDKLDITKIDIFFNKNKITYGFLPTKFAELFFNLKNTSLKNLVVAGEKLVKFTKQSYCVSNGYGPTENTVHTTNFIVDKQYNNIPIGKPIHNVKCYIVDNSLNILPIGAIGELVIGGKNLARGYLNLPELTAEKFIFNPFQTPEEKLRHKNSRLYKTGDLARLLPDGNIEYVGRNDFQVKIRGYRIELGEIENKILTYSDIKQAVVVTNRESDAERLVAYYVAPQKIDDAQLKNYLLDLLPSYAIPDIYIHMQNLPLTRNGKLNRKALPKPTLIMSNYYIQPQTEREKIVCQAFTDILGIAKVGTKDDFFLLGGNSILAIKLAFELQKNFIIKVNDIFHLRTPEEIALTCQKRKYNSDSNNLQSSNPQSQSDKKDRYMKSINALKIDTLLIKPIRSVLLTGATGYLGCNLLDQLLELTNYRIYILVRASSVSEALHKISKRFCLYFDRSLDEFLEKRIVVIKADIEQVYLGLSSSEYQDLLTKIDSIIHSAALTKHYENYEKFYSANVKATINLLEFSRLTSLKDFHYISTTSVAHFAALKHQQFYTEYDLPHCSDIPDNFYVQTKLLGEHQVVMYRKHGVNGSIHRVGNLTYISKNYRVQNNIDDNAFYNQLKCLFTLKISAKEINTVELSQVDLVAQIIVILFDKVSLSNHTHHIFNPHLFNMTAILKEYGCEVMPLKPLIEYVQHHIDSVKHSDFAVRFLSHLHQNFSYDISYNNHNTDFYKVLQNKTQTILEGFCFKWPVVDSTIVYDYLDELQLV